MLKTSKVTLTTVTDAEVLRVDTETTTLTKDLTAARAQAASLQVSLTAALERIAVLEGTPPPPPPPPPPPVTSPGNTLTLTSTGGILDASGKPWALRGTESMQAVGGHADKPLEFCGFHKNVLRCNTVSPLFHNGQTTAQLKSFMDAARDAGLTVGFNADHVSDGRRWLMRPEIVALVNSYKNVFLECEVETGWGQTQAQWEADVNGMVKALRDAGHVHLIKAGSPDGGRSLKLPLAGGARVLAADPLKRTCFTWQAYWDSTPPMSGWSYQSWNDFSPTAADPMGILRATASIKASKLAFVIGIDCEDDVSEQNENGVDVETVWEPLSVLCDSLGLGYQYWVLYGDHIPKNNVLNSWELKESFLTATGRKLQAMFARPVTL